MSEPIAEVAEVVRTAVAPVFLLSGVGVTLTMLTGRLARVVDRARTLERSESDTLEPDMQELHLRVETLAQRARLLGRAITLCTCSALLVSASPRIPCESGCAARGSHGSCKPTRRHVVSPRRDTGASRRGRLQPAGPNV